MLHLQNPQICQDLEHCLLRCKHLLSQTDPETLTPQPYPSTSTSAPARSATLRLTGDTIFEASVIVTGTPSLAAYIRDGYGSYFKLQQMQDCLNHITQALTTLSAYQDEKEHCDAELVQIWRSLSDALRALMDPPVNNTLLGFDTSNPRVSPQHANP